MSAPAAAAADRIAAAVGAAPGIAAAAPATWRPAPNGNNGGNRVVLTGWECVLHQVIVASKIAITGLLPPILRSIAESCDHWFKHSTTCSSLAQSHVILDHS